MTICTISLVLVVALTGMMVAGCHHASTEMEKGTSSFTILEQPLAAKGSPEINPDLSIAATNYRPVEPVNPLAKPIYPPKALTAKAGAAQVAVHVRIDTNGAVAEIRSSLLAPTIVPPAFVEDFHQAVEVALHQWKFLPAKLYHMETVTAEGLTYQRVKRTEFLEAEFDLLFKFSPSGNVESGTAAK